MAKRRKLDKRKGRLPGDDTTDAPPPKRETEISVGDISNTRGTVNIAGRDIVTHHTTSGLSAAEIKQLFDQIYSRIETRPNTSTADREDLKAAVEEIQQSITTATQKNESVDEVFLARRFRNIARMAPDILDVVVAVLVNPLAGLGVAIKKIAEKVKVEAHLPGDSTTDAPSPESKKKK
jgi:cell division septum initiation protein DivIVA